MRFFATSTPRLNVKVLLFAASLALPASLLLAQAPAPAAPATSPAADSAPAADLIPVSMLSVPEGFEVTLWAKSPMFNNPTNMDIDAQGRIWITEGVNYRKNSTRAPAGDKITVHSDTNGDGQADSSYTFIQEPGLVAPLGM